MEGEKGQKVRRLVFGRYTSLVQSEARLVQGHLGEGGTGGAGGRGRGKGRAARSASSSPLTWRVDHSHLASDYHIAMLAGMGVVDRWQRESGQVVLLCTYHVNGGNDDDCTLYFVPVQVRVVVVGLGGAALPMFLRTHLPIINCQVSTRHPPLWSPHN